jgi:hypothetical protein
MRQPATGAALPDPGAGERRVAARSVAWGGIESASSAAVGLLLTPLVLRVAGLEGLGLWGAAWSLAHTAGLVDLGIGASYTRFTARALAADDAAELNQTVSVGVAFHLTLAATIAILAVLFGPHLLERVVSASTRVAEARLVLACTLASVLLRGVLSVYRGVVAGAQRTDLLARIGSSRGPAAPAPSCSAPGCAGWRSTRSSSRSARAAPKPGRRTISARPSGCGRSSSAAGATCRSWRSARASR